MFRLAEAILCVLLAAAVQAQITTSRVNVRVTGADCRNLTNVFLVIDSEDVEDRWVPLDPAGACRWTADLGKGATLSTALSHFSLRADFARTDCRRAAANEEQLVAELEFEYKPAPLLSMRVETDPPMPVSYLRDVRPLAGGRTRAIPCIEAGSFAEGSGAIRHAKFSGENVYLQFGTPRPRRTTVGLLLDDIVPGDRRLVLTRDDIVHRLAVQRAQGKAWVPPTLSSNAIALDMKRLRELKLRSAAIEVLK